MTLPLLLAGPLVRRVEPARAAFWVALRESATVTATVWAGPQTSTGAGQATPGGVVVASGSAPTRQFGAHLHVATVVAEASISLLPGALYSYDITLDAGGGTGLRDLGLLRDATDASSRQDDVDGQAPRHLALGYATDRLPAFVLPGATLPALRLAHTSCRKSNGDGPDALAWLDDEIADHLSDPEARPQQLFLTGDQIYADDLGACLLPMLAGLGQEIVGFTEQLPIAGAAVDATLANLPALRRQRLCREIARFSSTDAANHLLTFGEYAAMYLAAWSPHPWRALAAADDVFVAPPANAADLHLTDWETRYGTTAGWRNDVDTSTGKSTADRFEDERRNVETWRDAVPRVARALANVATYMICDDHELTDDWYLTKRWRSRVLTAPLGRTVLRNGLMAYAVFQGWGNDPAAYTHAPAGTPPDNEKLLDAAHSWFTDGAATSQATRDKLETLLGMTQPVENPKVTFNYSVPGPRHMVRVLDTRTRRTYDGEGISPPKLLGATLDAQLPAGPLADGRELLVVISAAPVLFPRIFDALVQPVAVAAFEMAHHAAGEDDPRDPRHPGATIDGVEQWDVEGWHAVETAFEALIQRLGTYQRVVLLSGDVHFASSMVLDFWAKGDDAADARILQFTSSAARNQPGDKMRAALRGLRFGQAMLRGTGFERLAWTDVPAIQLPPGAKIMPGRRARLRRKPGLVRADGWPANTTIDPARPPDWRWRMSTLRDDRPNPPRRADDQSVEDLPAWNAGDPIQSYADVAAHHAQAAFGASDPLRLMVFRNNIGIVSFAADGQSEVRVTHAILSPADATSGDAFTEHTATTSRAGLLPPQLRTV